MSAWPLAIGPRPGGYASRRGGWLASQLAVEKGDKLVRIVLSVMLTVMAARYLGIIR